MSERATPRIVVPPDVIERKRAEREEARRHTSFVGSILEGIGEQKQEQAQR